MTADLKSLAHSRLTALATRGVLCRARQSASGCAVECGNRGVSDPPPVPWFLVQRDARGVAHAPAADASCPDSRSSVLPEQEAPCH